MTGDTYVYMPDTSKDELSDLWMAPYMNTYVAEVNDQIDGTYIMKPNFPGRGSHVANCSYMVHPSEQGQGIGKGMCKHSLQEAKRLGFAAMQFNLVVSTNKAAVHLWEKLGFSIVGTIPGAFNHQELGYVDAYIMYQSLS